MCGKMSEPSEFVGGGFRSDCVLCYSTARKKHPKSFLCVCFNHARLGAPVRRSAGGCNPLPSLPLLCSVLPGAAASTNGCNCPGCKCPAQPISGAVYSAASLHSADVHEAASFAQHAVSPKQRRPQASTKYGVARVAPREQSFTHRHTQLKLRPGR